jgi:hypothetical protein
MKKCVWVQPEALAQIEYDHLRRAKFTGLRQDKFSQMVVKEHAGES